MAANCAVFKGSESSWSKVLGVIFESMKETLMIIDKSGQIVCANNAALTLLSIDESANSLKFEDFLVFKSYYGFEISSYKDFLELVVINSRKIIELEMCDTKGNIFVGELSVFTETIGDELFLFITIRDLTIYKELSIKLENQNTNFEEIIRNRTRELEAANTTLLREISERKKVEQHLERRMDFEKSITKISSFFVRELNFKDAVAATIRELAALTGADRAAIFVLREEERILEANYDWHNPEKRHHSDIIKRISIYRVPYLVGQFREENFVIITKREEMPPYARKERKIMEKHGVRSLLAFPLKMNKKLYGFIMLENIELGKGVTNNDIMIIRISAEILERSLEHHIAQDELYCSYTQTSQIVESVPSALIGLDEENLVTHFNSAAERIFGIDKYEAFGTNFFKIPIIWNWNDINDAVPRCRENKQTLSIPEKKFLKNNGLHGFLNIHISPFMIQSKKRTGILILADEVTEIKMLEIQLHQSQKMESIGQLAAGIAHEINTPSQYVCDNINFIRESFRNILTVIKKYEELAEECKNNNALTETVENISKIRNEQDFDYILEEILPAANQSLSGMEHISKIVRTMKEFSHPGRDEKTKTDINRCIENTINVARNEWKYVSDINTEYDDSLSDVPILVGDFNQAILNIIVNAANAIEETVNEKGRGIITIKTKRETADALIIISDSGSGIPEPIKDKIFDPFFTTKEVGKGTGQGLSIVYTIIVKKHGGKVSFESEFGHGTTFFIRLPLET